MKGLGKLQYRWKLPQDVRQAIKQWNKAALLKCLAKYERLAKKFPAKASIFLGYVKAIEFLLKKTEAVRVRIPELKKKYFTKLRILRDIIRHLSRQARTDHQPKDHWEPNDWLKAELRSNKKSQEAIKFWVAFYGFQQVTQSIKELAKKLFPNSTKKTGYYGFASYDLQWERWNLTIEHLPVLTEKEVTKAIIKGL